MVAQSPENQTEGALGEGYRLVEEVQRIHHQTCIKIAQNHTREFSAFGYGSRVLSARTQADADQLNTFRYSANSRFAASDRASYANRDAADAAFTRICKGDVSALAELRQCLVTAKRLLSEGAPAQACEACTREAITSRRYGTLVATISPGAEQPGRWAKFCRLILGG